MSGSAIGRFGLFSPFERELIMILTVLMTIMSFLFFMVGLVGASKNENRIEDANWVNAEMKVMTEYNEPEKQRVYFGLQGLLVEDYDVTLYKDCSDDTCDECDTVRVPTIALLSVGFFLALVSIVMAIVRYSSNNTHTKIIGMTFTFLAFLFALVATFVFAPCANEVFDNFNSAEYGIGFVISVVGWVIMFIAFMLHLLLQTEDNKPIVHPEVVPPPIAVDENEAKERAAREAAEAEAAEKAAREAEEKAAREAAEKAAAEQAAREAEEKAAREAAESENADRAAREAKEKAEREAAEAAAAEEAARLAEEKAAKEAAEAAAAAAAAAASEEDKKQAEENAAREAAEAAAAEKAAREAEEKAAREAAEAAAAEEAARLAAEQAERDRVAAAQAAKEKAARERAEVLDMLEDTMQQEIGFEKNRKEITDAGKVVCDDVVKTLRQYPELVIHIQSHTSCKVGRCEQGCHLMELSQERVEEVKRYFEGRGCKNVFIPEGWGCRHPEIGNVRKVRVFPEDLEH
mmetsp:Transcript_85120/g.183508  ORF Transcript_85120/g.183508 Transcript_85120/m.183508 type:complete len:519 (-) Transcript_85120:89-1645(-)